MLKQYDFSFGVPALDAVHSEVAVKLHGALMHSIPSADAERLHERKYHPFSLYCVPAEDGHTMLARVSSLHESGDAVVQGAKALRSLMIPGVGRLPVEAGDSLEGTLEELTAAFDRRRCRLLFLTPSGFKNGGKETGFPDVTMHFISVIRRMNAFEGTDIDFDVFRKAFYRCRFGEWELRQFRYNISGMQIPGMAGFADIELPAGEEGELLRRVFVYATFSGTGGRTGMGMGGFAIVAR